MFNRLLSWLFRHRNTNHFSIEYYPITGRHYPKYKDYYYIKRNYHTGIYELLGDYMFQFADWGETEEHAIRIIDKVKEQTFKENVITKYL